jgi:L-2-hydroxyglutarate oxidase
MLEPAWAAWTIEPTAGAHSTKARHSWFIPAPRTGALALPTRARGTRSRRGKDHVTYTFGIIGAGIVGLATARELLRARPGASLVVLDKEDAIARHQTGHNSGVVHAGIYYAPGSLKARLCREGAAATKAFCAEQGIPVETCGKLLVATNAIECARLDALYSRSIENGVEVERIDAAELTRREPNITGRAALFVPSTAIVDYTRIATALARIIEAEGGRIELGQKVESIREHADGVEIASAGRTIRVAALIACAGLQSDRIATMAGTRIDHRIVPFRGEFYTLPHSRAGLISSLIYPVPNPDLPFVGIHLTKTIDGGIIVGPNAVLGLAREGYPKLSVNACDIADFIRFPGFWRTIGKHLGPGLAEIRDSLWKRGYLAQCRKYCPSLTLDDLGPARVGIRAQAVLRDGTLVHDFLFAETARMLHVCNAPSPAATSAIPIARMIVEKVLARLAAK